ncbi:MAG: hypothetical protein DSZ31_04515 [Gammaproteobacteria bacterium]|nr:MAG: hypothetical protein DSZ31_04515 [Gammaproteobacteria bacterium]
MKGKVLEQNLIENANKKLEEILENAKNLVGLSEKDFQTLANKREILLSWTDELATQPPRIGDARLDFGQ